MAASATPNMVSGMYNMWVAMRDSNGYPVGSNPTPNTKVNGTVYNAYRVPYTVTYTPPQEQFDTADERYGQQMGLKRDLGVSSLGVGTIELSRFDEQLWALIKKTAVDVSTNTEIAAVSHNAGQGLGPDMILGLSIGADNDAGGSQFYTTVFHKCTLKGRMPGSKQDGGTNQNPTTFDIVPSRSIRTGSGRLFSATGLQVVDNSDDFTMYRHPYQLYLSTFVKDGVLTTFKPQFLPVYNDVTGTGHNSFTNNGVTAAVTSFSTTTGIVTNTAAGVAGDIEIAFYPTAYVLSP
mgnify:CR=1 FL=1